MLKTNYPKCLAVDEIIYDTTTNSYKIFDGTDWHNVSTYTYSSSNNNLFDFISPNGTKNGNMVARISNKQLWEKHSDEILEWLDQTNVGLYYEEIDIIVFNSDDDLLIFQLKWT